MSACDICGLSPAHEVLFDDVDRLCYPCADRLNEAAEAEIKMLREKLAASVESGDSMEVIYVKTIWPRALRDR